MRVNDLFFVRPPEIFSAVRKAVLHVEERASDRCQQRIERGRDGNVIDVLSRSKRTKGLPLS